MHTEEMKHGAGTERKLQNRYLAVALAMNGARPSPFGYTGHIWEERLNTWRICVNALCSVYASTDEDFNADVFRYACNW